MGVTGLWSSILKELCEHEDLSFLSGKRVAVDLSGWVCQAHTVPGLNDGKKPHLRVLVDRVCALLKENIYPVFVIEGKMPGIKKRNNETISRENLNLYLKECHELLKCFGLPCIKAAGEAEAGCAYLYLKQLVDGVLTEDSDAFLYGAEEVYRVFPSKKENKPKSNEKNKDVRVYSLKSEKNKLKLDRIKLIAIALLLGCDYCKGVSKIGPETVTKFLEAQKNKNYDIFQRFKDWKAMDEAQLFPGYDFSHKEPIHCKRCCHIGATAKHAKNGCEVCGNKTCSSESKIPCSCDFHKNIEYKYEYKIYKAVKEDQSKGRDDFPDSKVINEYLNYTDEIPEKDSLEWKLPNKNGFLDISNTYTHRANPHKTIRDIIIRWQFYRLRHDASVNRADFIYKPVKITRTPKDEKSCNVQWESEDSQGQSLLKNTRELLDIMDRYYPELKASPKRKNKITDYMPARKKIASTIE